METDNIKTKTLLIVVTSIAFIESVATLLSSYGHPNPMLVIGVVRILEIITIFITVIIWGNGLPSIGLDRSITEGLKKGLLWSAIFGLIAGFIFLILHFAGINTSTLIHTQLPENRNDLFLFLGIGCIIGPVAEELFFRGVLYGFFRRWGISAALCITTIIFIFAHHNTGTIPVTQAIGGIVFAVAYEIEESLLVPIIIHILGNTAIFLLPFIM